VRGIFFVQLQNYVCNRFDKSVWAKLLIHADINESKLYFSNQQYPEEEFFKILSEALRITNTTLDQFLMDIGEKMVPIFFETYNIVINKDWKTLDLIERLEQFNYNILQDSDDLMNRGKFLCTREHKSVSIRYTSPRKMCYLAVGLMRGFAKHFNEKIIIQQTQCVFDNAPECHFHVTLVD
jgi:predicted hydrocarbon binding protein